MVLMGAMHGASPGFLSIPMPNTFSMGWNYVQNYITKHGLEKPKRDVFEVLEKRCKRFLKQGKLPGQGFAIHGDVRDLSMNEEIKDGSVKLVFSSPPYLKVIKYGLYNWIRLWWLADGHEQVDRDLDDGHLLKPYLEFMGTALGELIPKLNPNNGLICWVIGDVGDLNLAREVAEMSKSISGIDCNRKRNKLRVLGIINDHISDEKKVTKLWNSEEDRSGKATKIDRILIMCLETANHMKMRINHKFEWEPFLASDD